VGYVNVGSASHVLLYIEARELISTEKDVVVLCDGARFLAVAVMWANCPIDCNSSSVSSSLGLGFRGLASFVLRNQTIRLMGIITRRLLCRFMECTSHRSQHHVSSMRPKPDQSAIDQTMSQATLPKFVPDRATAPQILVS
jgi:hypothetical protein